MKIVLLGAPGCGKGTQASLISEKYCIPHISTGDIFRQNIKDRTEIGLKIKGIIDAGNLAPDELTIEIVKNRLNQADCQVNYLLDGFPRSLAQATALEEISPPDIVLDISIPLDKLEKRLTGRRSCMVCKNSFHVDFLSDKSVCPKCGGELFTRKDDNLASVRERLNVYKEQTYCLIDFYSKLNKLVTVNGDKSIQEVFAEIEKVLG